ncbi:MAG: peptidylprolyl isomerase [Candidatus Pacebacteria bacterium]|nr:peptidylprolyl isomerase [Candidatus Paceibacterota bacterium]
MDSETKVTYGIIGGLIILLIGLAYILQGGGVSTEEITQEKIPTNTPKKATQAEQTPPQTIISTSSPMENKQYTQAVITTNRGVIEIEFDKSKQLTVGNFGKLAESSFYNGVRFHRVIQGFMIQTGDPLSKDTVNKSAWGTGGPGYKFQDELVGNEQYTTGIVAMANSGPNTNGSQFFIVTAQPGVGLPPSYTVFGRVTKGLDVALAIEKEKTNSSDQPLEDIMIEKVEVK